MALKDEEYFSQISNLVKIGYPQEEATKYVDKQYIMRSISEAKNFYELRALLRTIAEKVL